MLYKVTIYINQEDRLYNYINAETLEEANNKAQKLLDLQNYKERIFFGIMDMESWKGKDVEELGEICDI